MAMFYCYARLTEEQLGRIQAFERETGKKVLAVREVDLEPALLWKPQVDKLREMEQDLGVVLIAVE
jgi:hypothetical protein